MPLHLFTTLTSFENFGLYSDYADSIAGYEVIDVLVNSSDYLKTQSEQFKPYLQMRDLRSKHNYLAPKDIFVKSRTDKEEDGLVLDKYKYLQILYHAYTNAPAYIDWFVLIDDDITLISQNLVSLLQKFNPRHDDIYAGSAVAGLNHIFAHGGSGIILSRSLMHKAFGQPLSHDLVSNYTAMADNECCGDYMVAVYLHDTVGHSMNFQLSGNKFQGEPIYNVAFNDRNWCQEIITLHSQSARDFELIWEYLKIKDNDIILHRDLYLDFIKPYLPSKPKPKWDNQAKGIEYSWLIDNGNDFKKLNNNNNFQANKNKKISSIEYEDKHMRRWKIASTSVKLLRIA